MEWTTKTKLLVGIGVTVLVTGVILIVLWQTGILIKSATAATVTPTPTVTVTPTVTTSASFDAFTSDLADFTDLKEVTATKQIQHFAVSADGSLLSEVVGDVKTADFDAQLAERTAGRVFGTATAVDSGTYDVWATAVDTDGTWQARVLQHRTTAAYVMRFTNGTKTNNVDIAFDTPVKAVLTDSIYFDNDAKVPTCYLGYLDNSTTYRLIQYQYSSGAWAGTAVSGSSAAVYQIYALSRLGMLHSVGATPTSLKPFYRTSTTADWAYETAVDGAFAGTLTNYGHIAVVLRHVDATAVPTAYKWDGTDFTSLGDGTALDLALTNEHPASQFLIAAAPNSAFFAILYAGSTGVKGVIRLYQVFSGTDGTAKVSTTAAVMTEIKHWTLQNEDYAAASFKLAWSDMFGLDIFAWLVRGDSSMSSIHLNCQPTA